MGKTRPPVDYTNPAYTGIFLERADRLARLRKNPEQLHGLKAHYANAPWAFVADWGMTFDPRNLERELISFIPFVPWPRQIEYLKWITQMWRDGTRGLVEKSRDCGVTWLSVGWSVAMWLFVPGFTIGFGSRKEELVDKKGDPKSIFEKVRYFVANTPMEFWPQDYAERTCCAHMRVLNPETGATITGEAGDEIGRGGRCSVYFVDEAAYVERQESVDAALSQTTNCQIDISTPNGNGNSFYKKRMRFNNTPRIFVFDWRDDPRKDDAWYARQQEEQDEVTVAQEIDRDYNASNEDAFIPAKWVVAAIDAHLLLDFEPSGIRVTGFDPADIGDAKAIVNRYGAVITDAKQLKTGDITHAMAWAFREAEAARSDILAYDGDGMGAPTMKMHLQNLALGRLKVLPYHGSGAVRDVKASAVSAKRVFSEREKTPSDTYLNYRAQTWSWARSRFELTYLAVERAKAGKLVNIDPERMISISSACSERLQLQAELSRPRRIYSPNGKIQVESKATMKARGVDSPNLADTLVIAMSARAVTQNRTGPVASMFTPSDAAMGY